MEWTCLGCGARWPHAHAFCGFCGEARAAVDSGKAQVDDVLRALIGEQLRARLVEAGGRLPEERRLVSAVFADLSGFTPLAGTLDPETLAAIVDPILAALVRVVKRHEGYVGSFAGDALLAYFGAPVAHEDDATRAVRCAHEMLEEFPALLASVPAQGAGLSLRIGVDTGAVMARLVAGDIRTDYNILGNSVNMAQRLQSNAPPGGCVVGEATYRLARDAFAFDDLGGLQVKGRAEPLPAFLLTGELSRSVQRREAPTATLVGRDTELAVLDRAQDVGPARALLLLGEAGAGKSRLLEEARRRSTRPWLEGGCAAHDSARSYRPWAGVLSDVPEGPDGPSSGVRIARGDTHPALSGLTPAARRDLVARDVAEALRSAAPVVVVLEDLHWADQPSMDLFDDVLDELGTADVLLLMTSREGVGATTTLPVLELTPLVDDAVAALIAELLGGPPPDVLVADVARRSGGNPLYVAELALALRERGLVQLVEGDVLDATGSGLAAALDLVPDSLEGLVGARIDALPSAQERALTIASVLGGADERLVTAVAVQLALPHADVRGALEGLRHARLLDGDRFVHAVVQNTAYVRTPRARRRTLHLAAAEVGPGVVADDELLGYVARHLYLSGAGPRAVEALATAATDALARGAHEEAVLHLRREVELRSGDHAGEDHRSELPGRLIVLGELLELLGRYLEAEPVLRDALGLGAGAHAARVLLGCLRRLGRYDDAVTTADDLLKTGLDDGLRARVSEEKAWSRAAQGDLAGAEAALEGAATPLARARHDLVRGYVAVLTDHLDRAETLLDEAVRVLESQDVGALVARGQRFAGMLLERRGHTARAVAMLESALAAATAAGEAEEVWSCLTLLSLTASAAGRHDEAVRRARDAVTRSDRMRHAFGRALSRNNLAHALIGSGAAEEALAVAGDALRLARSAGLDGMVGAYLHTRGSAHLALGDLAAARADADEALALVVGTEDEDDVKDLLGQIEGRAPASVEADAPTDVARVDPEATA